MNTKLLGLATLACAVAALLATPAFGQVVRETGTQSLAGILDPYNPDDSFTFSSRGNEILFADIDAEIFQMRGRRGGDHDDEGDCGGHTADALLGAADDGHDHDDSGGPGGICLQVLDTSGTMLCWADRPARPGWQRDPALACPLPALGNRRAEYTLRVTLKSGGCGPGSLGGHDLATASVSTGNPTPYLLNWSLRRIATDGRLQNQAARQE